MRAVCRGRGHNNCQSPLVLCRSRRSRVNQYGRVIPDYSVVIFDEAHLIEDIAADYFGLQVSSYQIEEIIRDTDNAADRRCDRDEHADKDLSAR